jgi:hypothetical protein
LKAAWLIGCCIASLAYWLVITFLVLGEIFDCIPGSAEYPCPTESARNSHLLTLITVGLAVYVFTFLFIRSLAKKSVDRI